MKRSVVVCALLAAAFPVLLFGQTPGQNVNMVSGLTWPGGDPYLQKQNEPSFAVSTVNPCHLLAGANDYRSVNLPGLPADVEVGDAWLGLFKSIDCGQTWFSTLVPGYLQDNSAAGNASPVKGLTAGADPTVRAGTGGLFFYSFIAFNRGTNIGKLAIARFIDRNNKEAGDPIAYLDTKILDNGSNGQFIDKPYIWITSNTGTCTVDGRTVPGNTVHAVWSVFLGSGTLPHTKIYYAKSSNCGASLDSAPIKLSESYKITQGATIAASLDGKNIYVVFRQFAQGSDPHNLLIAKSTNGGKTFTSASPIPILVPFRPFDQGTTPLSFRTNAFATAAVDHTGRLHVAAAIRGFGGFEQSRIVVTSMADGIWTMPQAVENLPDDASHQIMPALTYAGGYLHLLWYDLRDDAVLWSNPPQPFIAEMFTVRHTMDVRGARGTLGASTAWQTYGVLQDVPESTVPKISQYLTGTLGTKPGLRQVQFNMPNLRLYGGGTLPFMGDFIDIAGLNFVLSGQKWVANTGGGTVPASASQVVHAVWTDNRDAKTGIMPGDLPYAAPGAACTPEQAAYTGTRNANIYTARITPGLVVVAPGNAKPTSYPDGRALERVFAVNVQNRTNQLRRFQLRIVTQPVPGTASFRQFAQAPLAGDDLRILADIPAKSSIARSVFVNSTQRYPRIQVNVIEVVGAGQQPLAASTILNPDLQNPDLQNPDLQNPDLQNPDVQNAEVRNPDLQNPDLQNPDLQNPDLQNPDLQNPDLQNPDLQNPDLQNPDLQNPDLQNPDLQNPDLQNPDLQNPDLQNGSITDVSFDVTNEGNTTASYQVKFDVEGDTSGFLFQMIGRRVYTTPIANGCELALSGQNQILFNISNPDLTPGAIPDYNSGDVKNGTLLIRPGETLKVTLRAVDKDVLTGGPPADGDKATLFCPMLGGRCTTLTNVVTAKVTAIGANTGETTPRSDVESSIPPELRLAIVTDGLPPAVTDEGSGIGYPYSQLLQSTGGTGATRTWSLECPFEGPCPGLPPGLTLGSDGTITGAPDATGTYPFTVKVTDGVQTATRALTIRVEDVYENLVFTQQPPLFVDADTTFPVQVEYRNGSNNPVAGVTIMLALHDNATGALLSPLVPTAVTDGAGRASFLVSVDRGGTGMTLVAFPAGGGAQVSRPFDVADVLVVTNTLDDASAPPDGSLRKALIAANTMPGLQRIEFDIPGAGPHEIAPVTEPLPVMTGPVIIDGTTQPGVSIEPRIAVTGQNFPFVPRGDVGPQRTPGLVLMGGNSVVRGLAMNRWTGPAIGIGGLPGNRIEGNYLGKPDPSALVAGNGTGVVIANSSSNVIGGDSFAQRNVIGGNGAGIVIDGSLDFPANNNLVRGNVIGMVTEGEVVIGAPNTGDGVEISSAANNIVGGDAVGSSANQIVGNGGRGIVVVGTPSTGNKLRANRIEGNGSLGIDLGIDGVVTPNDLGDADVGPNALQNFPVLTSALIDGAGNVTVTGSLATSPGTHFVDFYTSSACDPSGNGEGARAFGSFGGLPDAGTVDFSGGLVFGGVGVAAGSYITALATDGNGNTSEFSNCVLVASPLAITFTQQPPAATTLGGVFDVRVLARDASGAVLPGVSISLSLVDNEEGAALFPPELSALTGAAGEATFTGLLVNVVGSYRLRADALLPGFPAASGFSTALAIDPIAGLLGPVGGSSGTPFGPFVCPEGSVGIALRGRAGDDIDRTELWCRDPTGVIGLAGGIGGDGGVPFDMTCPAGTVLSGIHGQAGAVLWPGVVVDTLGAACRNVDTGGLTLLGPVGLAAPGTSPYALNCPVGTSVAAIQGRQGALLDQIALICR